LVWLGIFKLDIDKKNKKLPYFLVNFAHLNYIIIYKG